jgi:hypothetical protein
MRTPKKIKRREGKGVFLFHKTCNIERMEDGGKRERERERERQRKHKREADKK